MSDTRTRVEKVLENMVMQGYEITDNSTFDDMGLDSIDKIELAMELEEEFEMHIDDEEMSYVDTFGELVEYMSRKQVLQ